MNFSYIFGRLKYKIFTLFNRRVKIPRNKRKTVFLFGTVEYMNYGDIAINESEVNFIKENFPDFNIVEVPERLISTNLHYVYQSLKATDIVAFQGGGNMGDAWPEQEMMRRDVFSSFKRNKIISFPQTTSFDMKDDKGLLLSADIYGNAEDITVALRESYSYTFFSKHFPSTVKSVLVPDIVFALKVRSVVAPREKVTAFLRRDKEKLPQKKLTALLDNMRNRDIRYTLTDTVSDGWKIITPRNRSSILSEKLLEFQTSRVVITDRLHGLILSVMTGTPVIVFDNSDHKIKHSYETWLKNIETVYFADDYSAEELVALVIECEKSSSSATIPDFSKKFAPLISAFNEDV